MEQEAKGKERHSHEKSEDYKGIEVWAEGNGNTSDEEQGWWGHYGSVP